MRWESYRYVRVRGVGHIIDHISDSHRTAHNLLTGERRPLCHVAFGAAWTASAAGDIAVRYDVAAVARLKYGITKAIARLMLSHKNGTRHSVDAVLDHLGCFGAKAKKKCRFNLREEAEALDALGIHLADGCLTKKKFHSRPAETKSVPHPPGGTRNWRFRTRPVKRPPLGLLGLLLLGLLVLKKKKPPLPPKGGVQRGTNFCCDRQTIGQAQRVGGQVRAGGVCRVLRLLPPQGVQAGCGAGLVQAGARRDAARADPCGTASAHAIAAVAQGQRRIHPVSGNLAQRPTLGGPGSARRIRRTWWLRRVRSGCHRVASVARPPPRRVASVVRRARWRRQVADPGRGTRAGQKPAPSAHSWTGCPAVDP